MLGTLRLGWRRALAFSLMVSMFIATLGISRITVNAQQKDPGFDVIQEEVTTPTKTVRSDAAVIFSNTTTININDRVGTGPPGTGNPYPSNISVTGLTGTISDVNVRLNGVTHTFPDDVDVLLVSPAGKKLLLQTDAGGSVAVTNRTYTFDQQAATQISTSASPAEGTSVRPGSHLGNDGAGTDVFPAPAPAAPYLNPGPETGGTAGDLSAFNGDAPNGTWSLFVTDDEAADTGSISGGWAIDITTSAPPVAAKPCFDFFGSGRTSFATFNAPAGGNILWKLRNNGAAGSQDVSFGTTNTDFLTPGYFDTDNSADINVWRVGTAANTAAFYFVRPSTAPTTVLGIQWGRHDGTAATTNDSPGREADYDGDGRDDPTVVRRVSGIWNWFYLRSSNNTLGAVQFGTGNATATEDIPLTGADYAGDNRADLVVLRQNAAGGESYIVGDSTTGVITLTQQWGEFDTDFYIIGDYLGDSKADFAVWRAFGTGTNGAWYIRENGGTGQQVFIQFGTPGAAGTRDVAVCGDYNGDGKSDIAVYRRSNSSFYWLNSPANTTLGTQPVSGGVATDNPVGSLRTF